MSGQTMEANRPGDNCFYRKLAQQCQSLFFWVVFYLVVIQSIICFLKLSNEFLVLLYKFQILPLPAPSYTDVVYVVLLSLYVIWTIVKVAVQGPEVEAEFVRITTAPLVPRLFAQLDQYTDQLIKVFKKKGGAAVKKIRQILAPATQKQTIEKGRECVLRALPFYLNEDPSILFKE